jgi:hypothetical protein
MSRARALVAAPVLSGAFGLAFGFSLGMVGFADFGEMHRMFTFQDTRMLLAFAGAVALAAVVHLAVYRSGPSPERIHKGVVPGALLFGAGWAISGGCPSIPLVQLGAGQLPALVSLAGILTGMRLFRVVNARWLRVDTGSCAA